MTVVHFRNGVEKVVSDGLTRNENLLFCIAVAESVWKLKMCVGGVCTESCAVEFLTSAPCLQEKEAAHSLWYKEL